MSLLTVRFPIAQLKRLIRSREFALFTVFASLLVLLRALFVLRRTDVFRLNSDSVRGLGLGSLLDIGFAIVLASAVGLAARWGWKRAAAMGGGLAAFLFAALAAMDTEYFAYGRSRINATFVAYLREWRTIAGSTGAELSTSFLVLHGVVAVAATVLVVLCLRRAALGPRATLAFGLFGLVLTITVALEPYTIRSWYGATISRTPILELARALKPPPRQSMALDESTRAALETMRSFVDPLGVKRFFDARTAPLAHAGAVPTQGGFTRAARPLNVMFVILEGLEAAALSATGGTKNLTPEMDRLASEGVHFPNFFANGVHTPRALDSALCGILPLLRGAPLSRVHPDMPMRCLPSILRQQGYDTAFIHGGNEGFENRIEYMGNIGFQQAVFRENWNPRPSFNGGWGASDEMIYERSIEWLDSRSESDRPWFLTVLSISNHHPWEPPDPSYIRETDPLLLPDNTIRYADDALSVFIAGLRKRDIFDNTLIFIFGDHGVDRANLSALPPEEAMKFTLARMNVPLVLFAPGDMLPPGPNHRVASQVDLLPTVLDLLDIDEPHHAVGTSLAWTWAKDADLPVFVPDFYSEKVALIRPGEVTVHPLSDREGDATLSARWSRDDGGGLVVDSLIEPRESDISLLNDLATSVDYLYGARRWWWEGPGRTARSATGTGELSHAN